MIASILAMSIMLTPNHPPAGQDWKQEASKLVAQIHREFYIPKSGHYAEKIGEKTMEPAFNWGVGVWLTALASTAKFDPEAKKALAEYLPKVEQYWNPAPPVAGYDVLPNPGEPDRYYDDNAWMVMALIEAEHVLPSEATLARAEAALKFTISAETDALGGGIFWKEREKTSKNTCINAPAVAAILAVHARKPQPELIPVAKRLYDWTYKTLRDPSDGLMWDNIRLDGSIERTKWSYNTALMIRSAWGLYKVTGQKHYREEAIAFAKASIKHWVNPTTGAMACEGKFAHLLFENLVWLDREGAKTGFKPEQTLGYLTQSLKSPKGHFGGRWDQTPKSDRAIFDLIDQASVARALSVYGTR